MENLTSILHVIRPHSAWTLPYPGNYEDLIWEDTNEQPKPTEEECLAAQDQANAWLEERQKAGFMKMLRKRRTALLQETDWWVFPDSPDATAEQLAYRQALRDLPANTEDPANPVWPVKPE